jgi:hypothetical protein
MELSADQYERLVDLQQQLAAAKIDTRADSKLVWDYVYNGSHAAISSLDSIVLRIKKAKYLHEYCNFYLGYSIAKNSLGDKILARTDWLSLVRKCVLSTTVLQSYPQEWPWEQGISPAVWKRFNDRTYQIKKYVYK